MAAPVKQLGFDPRPIRTRPRNTLLQARQQRARHGQGPADRNGCGMDESEHGHHSLVAINVAAAA